MASSASSSSSLRQGRAYATSNLTLWRVVVACACCIANRRKVKKAVRKAKHELGELQHQVEMKAAKGTVEGAGLREAGLRDEAAAAASY